MKIDGFGCDKCNKGYYLDPMRVGGLPEGWFALIKGSNGLIECDKHFCSLECLINWTSFQTVDSRKLEIGGPVAEPVNLPLDSEYWRRFDERNKQQ